jgi:hypothetical protein
MTVCVDSIALAHLGKESELMSIAPEPQKLPELDAGTRQAWSAYIERLRELTGDEYERAESESWSELQAELRRIELERESGTASAA